MCRRALRASFCFLASSPTFQSLLPHKLLCVSVQQLSRFLQSILSHLPAILRQLVWLQQVWGGAGRGSGTRTNKNRHLTNSRTTGLATAGWSQGTVPGAACCPRRLFPSSQGATTRPQHEPPEAPWPGLNPLDKFFKNWSSHSLLNVAEFYFLSSSFKCTHVKFPLIAALHKAHAGGYLETHFADEQH